MASGPAYYHHGEKERAAVLISDLYERSGYSLAVFHPKRRGILKSSLLQDPQVFTERAGLVLVAGLEVV